MKKLLNGYTIDSILQQITEKNGWEQCTGENGNCLYRNNEGKACAIGVFIPDDIPDLSEIVARNACAYDVLVDYPELDDFMPLEIQDLEQLQSMHDHGEWSIEVVRNFLETP